MLFRGDDARALAYLDNLATEMKVRLVATNDVHYHVPDGGRCTTWSPPSASSAPSRSWASAASPRPSGTSSRRGDGAAVPPASARDRAHPRDRRSLHVQPRPAALPVSVEYEGGETPMQKLERLTWKGAPSLSRRSAREGRQNIRHEFDLIARKEIAPYFLTVHEIVTQAREMEILCQGRGSAANSAVCYCLRITEVDPDKNEVLFERFLSNERDEPPDIDVDFEHERREEIIQWIYGTRAAPAPRWPPP
jgi:error-prone DNA polymerase